MNSVKTSSDPDSNSGSGAKESRGLKDKSEKEKKWQLIFKECCSLLQRKVDNPLDSNKPFLTSSTVSFDGNNFAAKLPHRIQKNPCMQPATNWSGKYYNAIDAEFLVRTTPSSD